MVKLYILKTIAMTISIVNEHLRSCFFVTAPCNFSFEIQNPKNSFSDLISTNLTTFDSTHDSNKNQCSLCLRIHGPIFPSKHLNLRSRSEEIPPETMKYWVGVQRGQSYLMGRRCLFSLGWQPF